MSQYTPEELDELAAGYALGATSPEETAAIEAAIAASPELAAQVRAYRDLTVPLARQRAVAPPPALRATFLREVRPRRRNATPWLALGLAASLVLAVGLAVQNRALQHRLARREATLNTMLLAEKDLYVARMVSADTAQGPGIQFFWNARQQTAVAHAFRLQPAPAGKAYQLWVIRDGKPQSIGVFNSDPDGHALVEHLTLPPSPRGVTQVLLTLEPAGGSPLPTTTPFVGGNLVTG